MLAKKFRLAKDRDIKKVFAQGKSFFNPHFTIKFLATATDSKRLTVVISTKVFKQAVLRNRLKRLLREQLRAKLKSLKNGDYLIIVKPAVQKLPETQILKNFSELLLKFKA